jgi:hypothetical protein
MNPTALSGAHIGGHTRFQLDFRRKLFPAAGRRVMLVVSAPQESADATVLYGLPGALGFCASAKPVPAAGRRDVRDPDGDTGREGLRWRSGVAAVGAGRRTAVAGARRR